MHAKQLTDLSLQIRRHAIDGIKKLLKDASVGDGSLELGDHEVSYSDGAEYTITELEFQFEGTEVWVQYTQEEEGTTYADTGDISRLDTNTLIELLEAMEKITDSYYDTLLKF